MFRSFKVLCSLVFGFLLFTFIATSIGRAQPNSAAGSGTVKVMTYNVNEGSDFVEVLSATNFVEFVAGAQATLNEVTSSNPPVRMRAIAHQIGITQPDLVGLQEISTWYQGPFDSPSVQYDMLQELLDAMAQQGLHYRVVVQVPEFQLAGPLDLSMANWLFVNDYDVMLARSDKGDMQISNVQWANFNTLLPVPTPIGPVQILRGWGSADVQLHGRAFRFIVTHLENYISAAPATLLIQEAQAKEINDGPAYVNMPVIIAGDFNADALGGDPTIATPESSRADMAASGYKPGRHSISAHRLHLLFSRELASAHLHLGWRRSPRQSRRALAFRPHRRACRVAVRPIKTLVAIEIRNRNTWSGSIPDQVTGAHWVSRLIAPPTMKCDLDHIRHTPPPG
jgi:endonuclease/exonuclease/phosphatase family metal-dependent hydrolase